MFVNLNTRSYYSLLSTNLSISDIIQYALKNNQTHVCLTDLNVLYGAVEFYDLAKKNNLVPIIGLEIFDTDTNSELVLIAKNNEGYLRLISISSFASSNEQYNIFDYLDDNLYVIVKSGNFRWDHKNCILNDEIACNFVNCVDETKNIGLNLINAVALKQANKRPKFSVNEIIDTEIVKASGFLNTEQSEQKYTKKQLDKLYELINECSYWDLDNLKHNSIIKSKTPKGFDSDQYLRALCEQAFDVYLNNHLINQQDKKRLDYELEIIKRLNFSDYFLFVHDFIKKAKEHNIIIGPGRGSAAGSFVSYLLNITTINPIKYGLIFERFLNPERKSMPDIDVDIMDNRREEVVDYLFRKYSKNNVAHIITFQRIKVKNAIRDVCRVLDLKVSEADEIIKLVLYDEIEEWHKNQASGAYKIVLNCQECSLDQKVCKRSGSVSCYLIRKIFELAVTIFNVPRQIGLHAAGVVCGDQPLTQTIPVQYANNRSVSQFSMEYLERFGLIKIDLLGLKTLTIIDEINNLVKINHNKNFDINNIPLNDDKTFNLLKKGYTKGIFQLESAGMQGVLKKVLPENLEDISIISALYRPGPQDNINEYVDRRFNRTQFNYLSDSLVEILRPTHGIIIYQEQVINTAIVVANFNAAQADSFRRAISKKDEALLLKEKDNFIKQAINNNYSEKKAIEIFEYLHKFADYGFNHSHSLAYAFLAYQMAYLKANYPKEFYVILLKNNIDSKTKLTDYFIEIIERNIGIVKPNINLSQSSFTLSHDNERIILGFNMIVGLANESANRIIEARNNQKFESFIDCLITLSQNKIPETLLKKLINAGAFDEFKLEYPKRVMIALVESYFKGNLSFKNDDDLISYEDKKAITNTTIEFLKKDRPELFNELTKQEVIKDNELIDSSLKVSFEAIKEKIYKPNQFKKTIAKLEKEITDLKTIKQLKASLQKEECSMLVEVKSSEKKKNILRFALFDGAYEIWAKVWNQDLIAYLSSLINTNNKIIVKLRRDIYMGHDSYTILGVVNLK
ncbi:DNA polymerase III subunit alpha [Mycoplasma sp. E35C]|uniref:DNA polymerase III subunit alpha n=1 Tax=Mycoplasma sp. E35C TaxID=2801918 RepID=UPI001CA4671A|nr:DNA polymerase III subunit alpha [Mycoplasma sp. E35C]QZX49341.1 DNA polymerase III subunit alpha [Mycoplasma sp. E35C]